MPAPRTVTTRGTISSLLRRKAELPGPKTSFHEITDNRGKDIWMGTGNI